MNFRTDLAMEIIENNKDIQGLEIVEENQGKSTINRMIIKSDEAAEKLNKPKGQYITISIAALTDYFMSTDERIKLVSNEISKLIPEDGLILACGLGNLDITPDALGPKVAKNILATRHIAGELAKSIGLENLRPVSVLAPGVLGKTGIEVIELLSSISNKIEPSCIIIIDALASRRLSRLGCTVQISDSGISPGAGVGNSRPLLNKETLGIPVISIGVPTVVDANTLAYDIIEDSHGNDTQEIQEKVKPRGASMIVTPREIDLLINRASFLIGMAVNCALNPSFSPEELHSLVS